MRKEPRLRWPSRLPHPLPGQKHPAPARLAHENCDPALVSDTVHDWRLKGDDRCAN